MRLKHESRRKVADGVIPSSNVEEGLPLGFINIVGLRGYGLSITPHNRQVDHAVGETEHHDLFEQLGKAGRALLALLLSVPQVPELGQNSDVLRVGFGSRLFDFQAGVSVELAQQTPQLLPGVCAKAREVIGEAVRKVDVGTDKVIRLPVINKVFVGLRFEDAWIKCAGEGVQSARGPAEVVENDASKRHLRDLPGKCPADLLLKLRIT